MAEQLEAVRYERSVKVWISSPVRFRACIVQVHRFSVDLSLAYTLVPMILMGLYVLFRATFRLRRGPALLGAAFVSASSLLLWISSFSFGMQMSAWPLLPLGLTLSVAAIEEAAARGRWAWPSLLVAAVAVAALPVAYQPASTLFLALLAGLVLARFVQSRSRLRFAGAAAALGGLSLLLGALPILDYSAGFSLSAVEKLGVILGMSSYIPPTDILGFTPFLWQAHPLPPVPTLAIAALAVMTLLMVVGLWRAPNRAGWLGLALGAGLYLGWLRFGQQFAYGYMKTAAYLAFPFAGLAAAGVQSLLSASLNRLLRGGVISLSIVLLALMVLPQERIVAEDWGKPTLFASEMPSLLGLRAQVPAGSHVRITSDTRISGPLSGIVANLLDHAALIGTMSTGYVGSWSSGDADDPGDYTLLLTDEDPTAWGVDSSDRVWSGGSFVLYRRAKDVLAHLPLDRTLPPGQAVDLGVGAEHLAEGSDLKGGEPRHLVLSLLAFHPAKLMLDGKTFDIQPGASVLDTGEFATPRRLVLSSSGTTALTVRSVTLRAADPTIASWRGPQLQPGTVLAQAGAVPAGTTVTTTVNVLVPQIKPITLALDISDRQGGAHYGWYGIKQIAPGETNTFRLKLDLASGSMQGTADGVSALGIDAQFAGLQRGDYEARLNLLAGTQLLGAPVDVFSFTVGQGGAVSNVRGTLSAPLVMPLAHPSVSTDIKVGDDVRLAGYDLSATTVYPGQQVSLTLWWQPDKDALDERSILIHLLDATGTNRVQADGPLANGGYPTSAWKPGDTVLDQHTFTIPSDLSAGSYTLAVGMYHYPSIQLVPMYRDGARLDGDLLLIPLTVVRW